MNDHQKYIKFLQDMKVIVQVHDGKVFGLRFKKDINVVYPDAWIDSNYGLQYVYLDRDTRLHIGWSKRPIEAARLITEIDRMIAYEIESNQKKSSEAAKMPELKQKFEQLKELINELDELHYDIKSGLKKEFDIDFKTYYRE